MPSPLRFNRFSKSITLILFVSLLVGAVQADERSIFVCIHGVWVRDANASWAGFKEQVVDKGQLGKAEGIYFAWGSDWAIQGSQTVGKRNPLDPKGMSMRAWKASDKLNDLIHRIHNELNHPRITLICHSQGTVVALAALMEEGPSVDNLIFLGSPLGTRTIAKQEDNTDLPKALRRVSSRFINGASEADDVVKLFPPDLNNGSNKGIGYSGLPSRIGRINGIKENDCIDVSNGTGQTISVCSYRFNSDVNIDHYGKDGWLGFKWIYKTDVNVGKFSRSLIESVYSEKPFSEDDAKKLEMLRKIAETKIEA